MSNSIFNLSVKAYDSDLAVLDYLTGDKVNYSASKLKKLRDSGDSDKIAVSRATLYYHIEKQDHLTSLHIENICLAEDINHHQLIMNISTTKLQSDVLADYLRLKNKSPIDYLSECEDDLYRSVALYHMSR